jgi:LPXTG-motif cell wall-anchored protein
MKSLMKSALVILGIALCTSSAAYAHSSGYGPEIDPSLAVGGLTLLAGTLAVLRVRRKK